MTYAYTATERKRVSFGKIPEALELPTLITDQRESYERFKDDGLRAAFKASSPIQSQNHVLEVTFGEHQFGDPAHTVEECREKDMTYQAPLLTDVRLTNKETGEIKAQLVPQRLFVRADGRKLHRVFENLLGNVSKYAMDNSRVYIDIRETEPKSTEVKKMVIFEVKNISGAPLNISADELMERVKRGGESRNTEGSGLVLAISKDLVKLMNGVFEITVDGDLFKATVMMEKA